MMKDTRGAISHADRALWEAMAAAKAGLGAAVRAGAERRAVGERPYHSNFRSKFYQKFCRILENFAEYVGKSDI